MADNVEIKLDQLTQAIKGLYAKSSMSQGEIYNALTSLSQRYENLISVSNEKVAAVLVGEFRKTIDTKYAQTNQFIKDLETSLKNLLANTQTSTPKMAAEITKLLSDTSNTYAKLNAQDLALQKIFSRLEMLKTDNSLEEITKLSDNFLHFSRGFENITITLNKNFADFLEQVKKYNTKEDYTLIQNDLNTISGNVNSVISAISIIDSKYRDLTSLIDTISHRENVFNEALQEVKNLTNNMQTLKESIQANDARVDIQALSNEIRNQIESVKYEIQKVTNAPDDLGFKAEIGKLINDIRSLATVTDKNKDVLADITLSVQALDNNVKNVHSLISDGILNRTPGNLDKYADSVREDVKALLVGLTSFKQDLTAINQGNIRVLQEPIERAMGEIKNQEIGKNIKELSDNLRDVAFEIQSSIQNMQGSLNDMNSVSGIKILTQIAESIPTIQDKLEIFRTHVVSENSTNLGQIKTSFSQVISEVSENFRNVVDKIQDDTRTINIETLDTIKVDLQRLSDQLIDTMDNIKNGIQKEIIEFRGELTENSIKQLDTTEKISEKISNLEIGLENFSNDTLIKVTDAVNLSSAQAQDILNEIKGDILNGISETDKANKLSITQFEQKVDKLLDNYLGSNLDNISEKKSLREAVVDIENKIERTNLQQIHNAKELLEEFQNGINNLSMKISSSEENRSAQGILNIVSKISDKIQSIEEFNTDLSEEISDIKEKIDQKLKENIQKISVLLDKPKTSFDSEKQNSNIDNLSSKVQEYLSNFEYLKSNISQEIKENLASEFSKIDSEIKKIRTSSTSSNYTYTLEDVESDLAKVKLTVEKSAANNEDFKTLFEKVVELRTVGLENVKINRDIEQELGHLSGWFKDTVNKIDELNDRIDNLQNIGFEDIKTRLYQSERSKANSAEFNSKLENTLKLLAKSSKTQDIKIEELNRKLEVMSQLQSEGFNPSQFIDIFYENMTQTKMLSNRVEIIEDKINSIQNSVEKLISYVEQ